MKLRFISYLILATVAASSLMSSPRKLELWHAMEGYIGQQLDALVEKFNKSQSDYEIVPTYKGNYTQTAQRGLEAAKYAKGPHILQVYEIATPSLIPHQEVYIPVHALFKKYGFNTREEFIPSIIDFYSDEKGQLLGLPFNVSTGVLYYNKDAFKKAGLDPEKPPQTWEEVEKVALKLKEAGLECGLTTAWPSGYLLEHFSARHNVPFATRDNGFEGEGAQLLVNSKEHAYNIDKFSEWQNKGIFRYAGRFVEAPEKLFTSGQCGMILQGTSRIVMLKKAADFEVGVGPLPYWASLSKEPHNLVTGGAALWAMRGYSKEDEKGVATFFNFIAQPENQQFWAEATGYMPLSKDAYTLSEKSGYYAKNPQAKIGIDSLLLPSTPYSKGIRVPGFVEVREILIDAMEDAFDGKVSAKDALDKAVKKGNDLIRKAEKSGI